MAKKTNKFFSLLLALLMVFSLPVTAFAASEDTPLVLRNTHEFLSFAERCRLDSYSKGLTVSLEADLDLEGWNFDGVPIFAGTFNGNGHTIRGLSVTCQGSERGLFRYLTEDAVLRDLTVKGEVIPEGTREKVGGLAGENSGLIQNCSFSGEVSGGDSVGGLAGVNTVTGIIENCWVSGSVHGDHFVGGLTGKNPGTVRTCTNAAEINVTANQNSVELSDVTMDSLTNTESVNTVTDIGGIAGNSTGVIRNCENRGTVGYQHMGYNVGGIAGSQTGYVADCSNVGNIFGRKEVGGIVGQMEPVMKIEYYADTLQILESQLNETSRLTDRAAENARDSLSTLGGQMDKIHRETGNAADAVAQLLPSRDNPHLPDLDALKAAQNSLSSSLTSIRKTAGRMESSREEAVDTMSDDIRAISDQMSAIANTVSNASQNIGAAVSDVSDSDTENDHTGKVTRCRNDGAVSGDLNAGGIVGAMAWENDFDPEDDFDFSGGNSLNIDSRLRAVVRSCRNNGTVNAKKRTAGGIAGLVNLGLIKNCENTGYLDGETAEFVGGIAGSCAGYIRGCASKCELSGESRVGGIAGSAAIVTDCRSLVRVLECQEKSGAVLGETQEGYTEDEKDPLRGNCFVPVQRTLGGIDGISYADAAFPLQLEEFLALEDLPELFREVHITFKNSAQGDRTVTLAPGEALQPEDIPELSARKGSTGVWKDMDENDLSAVYFDRVFEPDYTGYVTTVQSDVLRESGRPVLLAEGSFTDPDSFSLTPREAVPDLEEQEVLTECWNLPSLEGSERLRYALPEETEPEHLKILTLAGGKWKSCSFTQNGSYLVFSPAEGAEAFALINAPRKVPVLLLAVAGIIVLELIVLLILLVRRKQKQHSASVPVPDEVIEENETK